jgi:hypothetical protein
VVVCWHEDHSNVCASCGIFGPIVPVVISWSRERNEKAVSPSDDITQGYHWVTIVVPESIIFCVLGEKLVDTTESVSQAKIACHLRLVVMDSARGQIVTAALKTPMPSHVGVAL